MTNVRPWAEKHITRTFAVTDREENILKISERINDFIADKEVVRLDYWGGCVGVIATVTVKVPIETDEEKVAGYIKSVDQDGNAVIE